MSNLINNYYSNGDLESSSKYENNKLVYNEIHYNNELIYKFELIDNNKYNICELKKSI